VSAAHICADAPTAGERDRLFGELCALPGHADARRFHAAVQAVIAAAGAFTDRHPHRQCRCRWCRYFNWVAWEATVLADLAGRFEQLLDGELGFPDDGEGPDPAEVVQAEG
jgi:hypothetical protein